MSISASNSARIATIAATPVALAVVGAMVYQASFAAFTGQTRNSGNEWSTGSVNLTDDDNGQARFQVANMLPGDTDTKCIKVTANASTPSVVKGYTINPVTSVQGLENRIKVSIDSGTGGSFANCDGFVADATGGTIVTDAPLSTLAQSNSYDLALGGWNVPVGVSEKTYRFTWEFDTSGMNQQAIDQLQGAKTGIDMQWEMQTDDR